MAIKFTALQLNERLYAQANLIFMSRSLISITGNAAYKSATISLVTGMSQNGKLMYASGYEWN